MVVNKFDCEKWLGGVGADVCVIKCEIVEPPVTVLLPAPRCENYVVVFTADAGTVSPRCTLGRGNRTSCVCQRTPIRSWRTRWKQHFFELAALLVALMLLALLVALLGSPLCSLRPMPCARLRCVATAFHDACQGGWPAIPPCEIARIFPLQGVAEK